jgi:hypothetical protein
MELLLCTTIGLYGEETTCHVELKRFAGAWCWSAFHEGYPLGGGAFPTPQEALDDFKRHYPKCKLVSKRVTVKAATEDGPLDCDQYSLDGVDWEDVKQKPILPLLTAVYEDCEVTGHVILDWICDEVEKGFNWWAFIDGEEEVSFINEDPFPTAQEALDDFKKKFPHYVTVDTEVRIDMLMGGTTVVPGKSHG